MARCRAGRRKGRIALPAATNKRALKLTGCHYGIVADAPAFTYAPRHLVKHVEGGHRIGLHVGTFGSIVQEARASPTVAGASNVQEEVVTHRVHCIYPYAQLVQLVRQASRQLTQRAATSNHNQICSNNLWPTTVAWGRHLQAGRKQALLPKGQRFQPGTGFSKRSSARLSSAMSVTRRAFHSANMSPAGRCAGG